MVEYGGTEWWNECQELKHRKTLGFYPKSREGFECDSMIFTLSE